MHSTKSEYSPRKKDSMSSISNKLSMIITQQLFTLSWNSQEKEIYSDWFIPMPEEALKYQKMKSGKLWSTSLEDSELSMVKTSYIEI